MAHWPVLVLVYLGALLRPATVVPPAQSVTAASPAAPFFAAGTDIAATSAYVWRGFVPSGFSVQPSLWIGAGPVTVSSWMNLAEVDGLDPMTEHDLTVDYSARAAGGTISMGYINYVFPGVQAGGHSQEVYAGYAHASRFSPAVRVFHDFAEGSGTYVSAGAALPHAFGGGRWVVTGRASIGYNHRQWIDLSTWNDLNVGVTLALPVIAKRLAIAPFVARSQSLNAAAVPSRWYGGVGIGIK
ncbi:MAG: hypothetical protein HYU53_03765 [Acidobacteria bacterium]|nr:hypothetical protein [Acidobacteriota bacterium]